MSTKTSRAWTELEQKLLRLALCPAAKPGEVENATRALVSSWRARGLKAEILLGTHNKEPLAQRSKGIDPGDVPMPFGKYHGRPLRYIKRQYLRWVLQNCDHIQPALATAIRAVLEGGQ